MQVLIVSIVSKEINNLKKRFKKEKKDIFDK